MSFTLTSDSPLTALSSISSHSSGISSNHSIKSAQNVDSQGQVQTQEEDISSGNKLNNIKQKLTKRGSILNLYRSKGLFKKKSKFFVEESQIEIKSAPVESDTQEGLSSFGVGPSNESLGNLRSSSITSFISKSFTSFRKSSVSGASIAISDRSSSIEIEKQTEEKQKKKKRGSFVSLSKPIIVRSLSSQSIHGAKDHTLENETFENSVTSSPTSEMTQFTNISPRGQSRILSRARSKTLNLGDLRGQAVLFPASPKQDSSQTKQNGNNLINLFNDSTSSKFSEEKTPNQISHEILAPEQEAITEESLEIPNMDMMDTPESYFVRLQELDLIKNSKTMANIYAKIKDLNFTAKIVQLFMDSVFDFTKEPLDISLRKLLLELELPKETQHIDQVLDCFAGKYYKCNCVKMISPESFDLNTVCDQVTIFNTKDEVYITSFSLLLLHTDYFNSNNKNKMPKNDFIKNTHRSLSSAAISKEILEYFYENITITPFIKSESKHALESESSSSDIRSRFKPKSSFVWGSGSDILNPYDFMNSNLINTIQLNFDFNWVNYFKISNTDNAFLHEKVAASLFSKYPPIQMILNLPQSTFLLQNENIVIERASNFVKIAPQESNESTYLSTRIIKMGYIYKREKLASSTKLLSLNNESKFTWNKYFAVLSTIGLHFFSDATHFLDEKEGDQESFLNSSEDLESYDKCSSNENIYSLRQDSSDEYGRDEKVIFLSRGSNKGVETNVRPVYSFSISELFATQLNRSIEIEVDETSFLIYSKTGKNFYRLKSSKECEIWINCINYTTALSNLKLPFQQTSLINDNENMNILGEVCSKRYIDTQIKIDSYTQKMEEEFKNLLELFRQAKHYSIMAPLNGKTKEIISHNARLLKYKIDACWFEISKDKVMRNVISNYLDSIRSEDSKNESNPEFALGFESSPQALNEEELNRESPVSGDSTPESYPSPTIH